MDGFFPFTEPLVESDITCYLCDGEGCAVCKDSGWIEMGAPAWSTRTSSRRWATTPRSGRASAFGLGIDRTAFLRHGLPDLRLFWDNDRG